MKKRKKKSHIVPSSLKKVLFWTIILIIMQVYIIMMFILWVLRNLIFLIKKWSLLAYYKFAINIPDRPYDHIYKQLFAIYFQTTVYIEPFKQCQKNLLIYCQWQITEKKFIKASCGSILFGWVHYSGHSSTALVVLCVTAGSTPQVWYCFFAYKRWGLQAGLVP
jgi:hypothetical protein